ncbi:6-phosphofructokinase 3 [Bacteroides sp. CAG:189]|uniref:ATP-dependent 6-phosphofructokinase n=1 Tax=Bacteroides sp. CAG:189 TaxID=1262737 RepID=UPI0003376546|nr:ATP-dependent 6-phosphofructokinase [Bacteroides sp. CAG:189]CCY48650.1 6-phosphofructokinase 3 [Bacteroides sp. CAG:189]
MRIGILTSGGDCPGINATIRGVCKTAINYYGMEVGGIINYYGMEVVGIHSGFQGLLTKDVELITDKSLSGLLNLGGTILGTSREKPFKKGGVVAEDVNKPALIEHNIKEIGLDCVVCIGGNGTQKTAAKLAAMGLNIVSVPKTIDNDIWGTDISFGFDSAVSIATDAIDRLHSTASSHKRVMVIEVMGHKAGWIALYSGMAGGGDVILLPEIPYDIKNIGEVILNRLRKGKPYSIVVVAEGIQTDGRKRAAEYIAQEIEYETGIETRETVLGYIQRGGSPTPFDRNLSTRMGGHATELIADGQFGRMIALKGDEISSLPLNEVAGKLKLVTEDHDLVVQGRRMGICFG